MRDKGGTLYPLPFTREDRAEMAHLSKALWRNWGILEGSINPTGSGKERRSLILVVRESPPRARGRGAQGKFPEAGGSRLATRQPGSTG
ncbi:MAG: hypothetical protein ABSA09_13560 [Desulfobaccales bacterium]|jgi:hypothetical protein